jgi:hypothetical protein
MAGGSSLCPSATFMPKPVTEMYINDVLEAYVIICKQYLIFIILVNTIPSVNLKSDFTEILKM